MPSVGSGANTFSPSPPGVRARREELLGELGRLGRAPETDLVDGQDVEALGEHAEGTAEVRPRGRTGAAAVQQQHCVRGRVAGLVVVQPQPGRQVREPARRLRVEYRSHG
jgi:hypothetical protein